jgi:hypothetical protein
MRCPLHNTDWIILKEMSMLPICDNCLLKEQNSNFEKSHINQSLNKIIKFPQ